MDKILFPTEFSEHSPEVFKYALELAKHFNANIVAMHVCGKSEQLTITEKEENELAEYTMDVLVDFVEKHKGKRYKEVEVEYILAVGAPAKEILDISLDENIGLVVMGMTGKTNAIGNIFGTISQEVINRVDCPILVIPATAKYIKPTKLVYTTDFLFRDIGAINALKTYAEAFNAKIHCLHIVEKGEDEMAALVNMGMLKDNFKDTTIPKFEVINGGLIKSTNQYLEEQKVGMVAMLSRKRSMFQQMLQGSTAKKVAQKIDVPLLVFKGNAYEPIRQSVDFSSFSVI